MDRPRYHVLPGTFVAAGYSPDGDSIRFAPDRLGPLDHLPGTLRLRVAKDTSVQLRLGSSAPMRGARVIVDWHEPLSVAQPGGTPSETTKGNR